MGSGTQDPLRGGLFSFGGSIQQSCGLLHGEEQRPPEALGRSEAPPARDFAFHPPTLQKERKREKRLITPDTYHLLKE